jgi:hypothetical protein
MTDHSPEHRSRIRRLTRSLVISLALELVIYATLLIIYFLIVLRYLQPVLAQLFASNLTVYGFIGLGLIVGQAVLLDLVTAFLVSQLNLEQLD